MSGGPHAMLLRWRVKPGREGDFARAWDELTLALLGRGSLGSALFDAEDGSVCAVPRWPDEATRAAAMSDPAFEPLRAAMADAVAEVLPPIALSERINRWVRP